MTAQQFKIAGFVCLAACAMALFVGWERYNANANAVRAMNTMSGGMMGSMLGAGNMKPATPAITKYCLFFAMLTGIGGVVCLVQSKPKDSGPSRSRSTPKSATSDLPDKLDASFDEPDPS